MRVLKANEIAQVDRLTIQDSGIPSLVLMESAGRCVFDVIKSNIWDKDRFLIVAGSGNNGGDAVVVARYLKMSGKDITLFVIADDISKLSDDNRKNIEIAKKFCIEPVFLTEESFSTFLDALKQCEVVVDGIFGTGFKPPVKGFKEKIIHSISKHSKFVVSIDIPSGLDADSYKIFEPSIKADITVTFGYKKPCHILYPASESCGNVFLCDIGLNDDYAQNYKRFIITPDSLKFPVREKAGHKYTFGHVGIIGGSVGKSGAVIMTAKSATRSGSGLVTVIVPECIDQIVQSNLIEEMSFPLVCEDGKFGKQVYKQIANIVDSLKISSVVAGMGMGVSESNQEIVREVLKLQKPVVIDADGLNNLAVIDNYQTLLKNRDFPTVLTPHIGEFSRLTGYNSQEIFDSMEEIAREFVSKTNTYLILKFSRMMIATPDGEIYYNLTGNPGMATAGSGDVLAGIVGALINRLEVIDALKLAVYIHGKAGDLAAQKYSQESMKATDIIEFIPSVFKVGA